MGWKADRRVLGGYVERADLHGMIEVRLQGAFEMVVETSDAGAKTVIQLHEVAAKKSTPENFLPDGQPV